MKKTPEIYRMNFLVQGKAAFTYKNMLTAMVGWVVFLALLFFMQAGRQVMLKREMAGIKKNIELLNAEKEKQIGAVQLLSRQSVGTAVRQDLVGMIETRPLWSKVLDNIGRALPAQVWLDSVGTSQNADGTILLKIVGKARTQREVTNFIMQLEAKGLFQKTSLLKTKQAEDAEGLQHFEVTTYPQLGKFH